jgi:hypothetical protein
MHSSPAESVPEIMASLAAVFPEQVLSPPTPLMLYPWSSALRIAVFRQALRDYQRFASCENDHARQNWREVVSWFWSEEDGVFSCVSICELLEIDIRELRKRLLQEGKML